MWSSKRGADVGAYQGAGPAVDVGAAVEESGHGGAPIEPGPGVVVI